MTYANIQSRKLPFLLRYSADLVLYRHLCWNLVASDLRSRFRRSYLGILWAIIQPLAFALMIAGVWGTVMGMPNYLEFAIYVFSGLIVWDYFGTVVGISQDALVNAEGYLKQTRIPFIIFQVRTPFSAMLIFLCGFAGLIVLMLALGSFPPIGLHLILLPLFVVLLLLFVVPIAIIMSVMGTLYRDVKYISQIAIQGLFFLSPVMLDRGVFDRPELEFLKYANPVFSLLDLFRSPLLHGELWRVQSLGALLLWIVALWGLAALAAARGGRRLIFAL